MSKPKDSQAPVCPRCLGINPGYPSYAGSHPDPNAGPYAVDLCRPCVGVIQPILDPAPTLRDVIRDLDALVDDAHDGDARWTVGALNDVRHARELVAQALEKLYRKDRA